MDEWLDEWMNGSMVRLINERIYIGERRRLLQLLRNCDNEKPCDVILILVADDSSGSLHPVNVYDV